MPPTVEKTSAVAQNIIKVGGGASCYSQSAFLLHKRTNFRLQLTVWTFLTIKPALKTPKLMRPDNLI